LIINLFVIKRYIIFYVKFIWLQQFPPIQFIYTLRYEQGIKCTQCNFNFLLCLKSSEAKALLGYFHFFAFAFFLINSLLNHRNVFIIVLTFFFLYHHLHLLFKSLQLNHQLSFVFFYAHNRYEKNIVNIFYEILSRDLGSQSLKHFSSSQRINPFKIMICMDFQMFHRKFKFIIIKANWAIV
jgi:hypothetical protein